jgi:hypothetical protein
MNYFNDSNIDFWIKENLNVLLRGKHGVGKTARILEAFKRNNLRYQYFSASTMDPWVDFIGVPKERMDEKGNPYLDLVRPKNFQNDEVEAIFLDEFNRSSKKVRNAVMELIQFKSINGKKFNNLKIVWAAINPEDEEVNKYDVEALDPAQMDRFHVILNIPYAPDADYFRTKYGRDTADIALQWWKETLKDNEKDLVSPRRLDYMLDIFNKGGDLKPLVHSSVNLLPLTQQLKNGPVSKQIDSLFAAKDTMGARKFLFGENNYNNAINYVLKKPDLMAFFLPLLNAEKTIVLMNQHKQVAQYVFGNYDGFREIINTLSTSKSGQLSSQASEVIMKNTKPQDFVTGNPNWKNVNSEATFQNKLTGVKQIDLSSTQNRSMVYRTMLEYLPEQMSSGTATEALRILETLLTRSVRDTVISQMSELTRMIVHTITTLENHGVKWNGIVDQKAVTHKMNEINTFLKQSQGIDTLRGNTGTTF